MPTQATWFIYLVVIGFIVYMMIIRPNNKRMREQQAVLNALTPGTRVLLNTGMFATVTIVGERQIVAELAPGMEVTCLKQAVVKLVTPDDEEFEFSDEYEYVGHEMTDGYSSIPVYDEDVIDEVVIEGELQDDAFEGIGQIPEDWSDPEKDSEN